MNVFSRGIRNAFRNGIRTFAIVGMLGLIIGLALAMLLAHQAVGQKIASVQKSIGNTITVTPAGIQGFEGGGNPLTTSQIAKITSVAHVTSVTSSLEDRLNSSDTNLVSAITAGSFGQRQARIGAGFSANGTSGSTATSGGGQTPSFANFTPPVTVVGTTTPLTGVTDNSGGNVTLKSGKSFDGTKDAEVALVGATLATKNNLKVGSTFTAYSTTFTVVGIFDAGNTFSNNQVIMPLPTVQRLSDQTGDITSATVYIDNATNLNSATSAISKDLGSAATVTNTADETKSTLSSLQNIQNVSLFTLIGAASVAAAVILLTMIMIVRERRREIGVLKAIGGSNIRVMLQFTVESITLTVLAALIGVIIGSIAATPVTKLLANNSTSSTTTTTSVAGPGGGGGFGGGGGIRARFDNNSVTEGVKNLKANVNGSIVLDGLGSAILIAMIGSTAAAGLIAKVRPAEVMRVE